MRPWILFACCVSLVAPKSGAGRIDEIYFFGDSHTDTGNMALIQPALVPGLPFVPGRFCDGLMWPEYLSFMLLGDSRYGRPFLYDKAPPQGNNFAVVGAATFEEPNYINLPQQIDAVIAHQGGTLNPHALYVISFPTADIASYYEQTPPYALNVSVGLFYVWRSAQNLYASIARLHAAGARQFLIFNTPNAGYTPLMRSMDFELLGYLLSAISNVLLQVALSSFPDQLSGELYLLDFYRLSNQFFLDSVLAGGREFGLTSFASPCILQTNGQVISNPDCSRSAFVDGVHISSRAHFWLATEAATLLSNPPLYTVPPP